MTKSQLSHFNLIALGVLDLERLKVRRSCMAVNEIVYIYVYACMPIHICPTYICLVYRAKVLIDGKIK